MEFQIPHEVIYETADAARIADVIESLMGTERAARELGPLLEACVEGLRIESIEIGVKRITQDSPLRELFFVTLVAAYQTKLAEEMPNLLHDTFGVKVPDQYETIVTICLLVLLFYGADYLYRRFHALPESHRIKRQLDGLIRDLVKTHGCSEEKIRQTLEQKYGGSRLKSLAKAAIRFFSPSKQQSNAPILSSGRKISRDTVAEVPGSIAEDSLDAEDTSQYLSNVEVEIHAQDVDRAKIGWAAAIPGYVDKRVKMAIFPPVTPEQIYTKEKVRGDVVVVSERQDNGELKPVAIHLLRVVG